MKTIKRQSGLTTVEFAIIGTLVFVVLFGVIEVARAFFVWNTLVESTRRGARVAAVCDPGNLTPIRTEMKRYLNNITDANISIQYLNEDGQVFVDFEDIRFARVGVVGYQHTLMIPLYTMTITAPPFWTTLQAESLGWVPEDSLRDCMAP